jgi:hypothetical protein
MANSEGVFAEGAQELNLLRSLIEKVDRLAQAEHAQAERLAGVVAVQAEQTKTLERILSSVTPPVAAAFVFGWNGSAITYPFPKDPSEVIVMTDFSAPDTDKSTAKFSVLDADGNIVPQTAAPTVTADVTNFGTLAAAAAGNADGSWDIDFTPTQGAGVGTTNITIQAAANADGTAVPAATTSVTSELSDGVTPSAVWADDGPTVTTPAAPAAPDTSGGAGVA